MEFNRVVSRLGNEYSESALLYCTYLALLKHLKNKMLHYLKSESLNSLHNLVLHLNQCHWECRGKIACKPDTSPTPTKSDKQAQQTETVCHSPSTPNNNNNWGAHCMVPGSSTSGTLNRGYHRYHRCDR